MHKTTDQDLERLEALASAYESGSRDGEKHERDEHFASLLRFFHSRLSGHPRVAAGVNMVWELVIYDLAKGVDGFTGQPLRYQAAGLPPSCYALYRLRLGKVAEACFSPELAAQVVEVRNQIKRGDAA